MSAPSAAITFFYYEDIGAVAPFYEDLLGLTPLLDQGFARLYRIAPGAALGIVDGARGHCAPQPRSAVLLTLLVEDVAGWHARLAAAAVPALTEIRRSPFHEYFFFEDPVGYAIEMQRFLDPEVAARFG